MNRKRQSVILPFSLTLLIILLDQLSKWWIVDHVRTGSIYASFLSDFLWIVHVRNNAVGFSLGSSLPDIARTILFIVLTPDPSYLPDHLYGTVTTDESFPAMGPERYHRWRTGKSGRPQCSERSGSWISSVSECMGFSGLSGGLPSMLLMLLSWYVLYFS